MATVTRAANAKDGLIAGDGAAIRGPIPSKARRRDRMNWRIGTKLPPPYLATKINFG